VKKKNESNQHRKAEKGLERREKEDTIERKPAKRKNTEDRKNKKARKDEEQEKKPEGMRGANRRGSGGGRNGAERLG